MGKKTSKICGQPEQNMVNRTTAQIEDIITSDDILCSIISSLPLIEAARTSVLSRRWKYIWTHLSELEFDYNVLDDATADMILCQDSPLSTDEKLEVLEGKTDQFIQSVNSVLQQHQGCGVHSFIVGYLLHKTHSDHLDAWIRFVVRSKVKNLDLFLNEDFDGEQYDFDAEQYERYDFPCQLLEPSSLETLRLTCCSLKPQDNVNGLSNLRCLDLINVNVTDEDINCLLYNCYTLETLVIDSSKELETLNFLHPLSKLQSLRIRYCQQLTEINIDAVNMRKLHYCGKSVDFKFTQSSKLTYAEIMFELEDYNPNLDCLRELSRNLPHLVSLDLIIYAVKASRVTCLPILRRPFIHLKYFCLYWFVPFKMSHLHLSTILDAAPLMELFELHFSTRHIFKQPPRNLSKLSKRLPQHPYILLKTIQIFNFCWDKWQIKILLYLLKNATKLETMTIHNKSDLEVLRKIPEKVVENLRKKVPSNVKLVVL